jgi:hypothetical protein
LVDESKNAVVKAVEEAACVGASGAGKAREEEQEPGLAEPESRHMGKTLRVVKGGDEALKRPPVTS